MTQSRRVTIPVLATLLLHGTLIAFLLLHLDFQPEPRQIDVTPRIVQAKLVSMEARAVQRTAKPATPPPAPRPTPKPEPAPAPTPAPKPEPKPEPEKAAPTRADLEKKKLEEQKKLDAQKKLEEQKRKEAEAKQKAEQAKRAEAERQRKLREEAERQRQQELMRQEMARAMQAEEQAMAAETEGELVQSYAGLIKNAVERAWSRPPSARTGMQALLVISMLPTGEIHDVSVLRSSGNDAFDRSAVNAVKKVGYFPELQKLAQENPRQFDRNFRRFQLDFYPEDLRL